MTLEEYMESEVVVAVAATAAILSPKARRVLRRGAVYGLAGVLMARDAIASAATMAQGPNNQSTEVTNESEETRSSMLRRGLVAGLSTAMSAGDAISATARNARTAATNVASEAANQARTETTNEGDASPATG